jgi:hypothetical protein
MNERRTVIRNYRIRNRKPVLFACLLFAGFSLYAQQISNVNQITTIRQKISPVKVSDAELRNIKSKTPLITNTLSSSSSSKSLPGVLPIEVSSPGNNDIWEAGKEYLIRWSGASADVRIDLESTASTGGRPLAQYSIVGNAPNTGTYRFRVPFNWITNPFGYVVRVKTLDGKQTGSSASLQAVYTQAVDLECRIVDAYIKTDVDFYVVYAERDTWLEFNVLMRNKGVSSPVTIENVVVRIIKEPEGVVVRQEEWGFSGIYGHEWYKLPEPRKFDIEHITATPVSNDRSVDLKNGAYRVEVELDPQNRLGENQQCRSDNKCVKIWQIR